MAEYRLYGFGESGNAYKAALMLELCGCDWEVRFVNYFGGETRTSGYRDDINELGEVPVLDHAGKRLSQSGVILTYLAERTGKFAPHNEDERLEVLRWILFDNHKFTSYYATLRFMVGIMKTGEPAVLEFLRGRALGAYSIVDKHLQTREFLVGNRPTIADISLAGYVFFDEPSGIDRAQFPSISAWSKRIAALPAWKPPYELLPAGLRKAAGQ